MDIRSAILAAADHIERNPRAFQFCDVAVPERGAPECGTPGCAIGWVAHFTGMEFPRTGGGISRHHKRTIMRVHDDDNVCKPVLGVGHDEFYARMEGFARDWVSNAGACARALRLYADAHHPATTPAVPLSTWDAVAKDIGWRPSLSAGAGSGK